MPRALLRAVLGALVVVAVGPVGIAMAEAPTVTSIAPTSGTTAGSTAVVIKGSGFVVGATVKIGSAASEVNVVSEEEITAVTAPTAAGSDEVIVEDINGTSTSGPLYTYVAPPCSAAPAIETQPANQTVTAPDEASFTVTEGAIPAGCSAATIQWQVSTNQGGTWSNVSGATPPTLSIEPTSTSESENEYRAELSNANVASPTDSTAATLTVEPPLTEPKVSKQPAAVTVNATEAASFTAEASGNPSPTVQWEVSTDGGLSFEPVSGAGTSDTYTIPSTSTAESGNEYRTVFTNSQGKATSNPATLTVNPALVKPVVSKQPEAKTVNATEAASFTAEASGNPSPTVQWEVSTDGGLSFEPVSGAGTSDTYTISSTSTAESGNRYEAVFTNSQGKATSSPATLTVNAALVKPAVTKQPGAVTVNATEAASFTAEASGNPSPSVQWEVSEGGGAFVEVPGATSDTYMILSTSVSESGDRYEAVFTNSQGKATSNPAMLTVNPALVKPAVTKDPKAVTVNATEAASFTAEASGNPAPSVQWEVSEGGGAFKEVPGATSDTYTILSTSTAESGDRYEAVFTNSQGKATSNPAMLTVNPALVKPVVSKQPGAKTVNATEAASFTAEASGNPAPMVQWEVSESGGPFEPVVGATSDTYTILSTSTAESGDRYEAVFTNSQGKATSNPAMLTVNPALVKPAVTKDPKAVTVNATEAASFTAEASGNPAPSVQWEVSEGGGAFKEVPGATSDTYTILSTSTAESGDRYEAVFTNSQGKAMSNPAMLTVNPALVKPAVTNSPKRRRSTRPKRRALLLKRVVTRRRWCSGRSQNQGAPSNRWLVRRLIRTRS